MHSPCVLNTVETITQISIMHCVLCCHLHHPPLATSVQGLQHGQLRVCLFKRGSVALHSIVTSSVLL
jgi:hypothetical protein